jgi:primosomal protein N' (replication factor Y)
MARYAKVRFPSALPQLDKEFDYSVPEGMVLAFGQLVSVPFGPKRSLKTGIVVGLAEDSIFADKVLPVTEITSVKALITTEQLDLALAVSQRQAGSVGELLSTILPKRMKRTEASYTKSSRPFQDVLPVSKFHDSIQATKRTYIQYDFVEAPSGLVTWAEEFALLAADELREGRSTLVVLPDFRAVSDFEKALEPLKLIEHGIRIESSDSGSDRYLSYLRSLDEIAIVYGVRSTAFMPAQNLGLMLLLDDADDSHTEQSAPYWNSRDVLLQRQELEDCRMVVSSLSPSAEMVRLIGLDYFQRISNLQLKPLTRITNNHTRLDDESFGYISQCLRSGKPVLIQTSNLGQATGVVCKKCRELRTCPQCEGRVWIDSASNFRCRSCKFTGSIGSCACGGSEVSVIKLGSSGLAESLEKAFPDANVVHSSGQERITEVDRGSTLVIATTGAEPYVHGGYACVLLADAYSMVAGSRLRSLEQAALRWANAASHAARDGLVIFVGLTGDVASQAMQLDFFSMIQADFKDRVELGLPPATRLVSITSNSAADLSDFQNEIQQSPDNSYLRKLPGSANQLVFIYPYSEGAKLSELFVSTSLKVSNRSKHRKPGQRLFRICMDDSSVL